MKVEKLFHNFCQKETEECLLFVSELVNHITASDPIRRQYCFIPDKTLKQLA